MKARYLYSLSDSSIDVRGGNKAKNLRYLMKHKYPVPKGFVLVYDALEQYENDPEAVLMHVRKELIENLHPELSYAVRSSASLEGLGDFSCAGAFESYLHVRGADEVLQKILAVWASLHSEKLKAYLEQSGLIRNSIRMAVIIQEMVLSEAGLLGIIGGILGLLLGLLLSYILISAMGIMSGYQLEFVLPRSAIYTSILVAFVTSLLAAVFPARKAARIPVLSAIQYE